MELVMLATLVTLVKLVKRRINEMNYSITRNGKQLDPSKYTIDTVNRVFTSSVNGLVLDFNGLHGWTFDTSFNCTFITGYSCTFKTSSNCTFDTGYGCTFDTGYGCTFKTSYGCTFDTGEVCTFDTGYGCTFDTGSSCTFKTDKHCVVVRRDVYEVIEVPLNTTIKLNDYGTKGFTEVKDTITVTIDGNSREISKDAYNTIKGLFNNDS
jgi:hypothetical protein